MKHLILLCDYGLDDAIATVFLLNNKHLFDGIDILPVGGNVPQKMALDNAKVLLSNYIGFTEDVCLVNTDVIKQPEEYLPHIHGKDGIGDVLERTYNKNISVESFYEWIQKIKSKDCVILSLGPCTVTNYILEKKDDCELILMGGCIKEQPNFHGYEFNHCLDRGAFANCIKHTHKIVTLDTCSVEKLNFFNKKKFEDNLIDKLIRRIIEISKIRGLNGCYIYDYIAAIALVHPELFAEQIAIDKDGNKLSNLKYIGDSVA